jgi:uncharacterized RDD family membrane protein YckC
MKTCSRTNRPRWSLLTQFWAATCIAILTSVFVILVMKRSLWIELEVVVGLLSIFYFIYLYILIFKGIRFNKNETYSINWKPFDFNNSGIEHLGLVDTGGVFTTAFAEAGPVGCLVGIVLDIVASIFLVVIIAFILWLGMNVITTGILVLFLPLFILFRRSLRIAIVKGRTCHEQTGKSLLFAAWATLLNMTWLYVVIYLGNLLHRSNS